MKLLVLLFAMFSLSTFAVEPDQKCLVWRLNPYGNSQHYSSFVYDTQVDALMIVSNQGLRFNILVNGQNDLNNQDNTLRSYYPYAKLCGNDIIRNSQQLSGKCSCLQYSASNSKLITDKVAQAVATELEKVNTKMHQQYVDDTFSLINEIGKNLDIMVKAITGFFDRN